MIGPLFDMFTGAMLIFSCVRFLNMCKPRTGWPTSTVILWEWAIKPSGLAGDGEYMLTRSISSEIFLQKVFIILQGRPIKKAVFLPGKPASYNQLLIQSLMLVPDCYCA